jgi:hypothetical protein
VTATARFKVEEPIRDDHVDCLVALVGLDHTLRANARGVLERCQLRVLEFTDPLEACRVLETITPEAVVLDSHHPDLKHQTEVTARLMRALSGNENQRVPLVILSSTGLSAGLQRTLIRAGGVFLPVRLQTYREIAAVVRRLCGLAESCCVVGETPESSFNASAIDASHPRYER